MVWGRKTKQMEVDTDTTCINNIFSSEVDQRRKDGAPRQRVVLFHIVRAQKKKKVSPADM